MDTAAKPNQKLGKYFRELIKKKEWTIAEAADKCGVPDPSLRSWLLRNCFPRREAERLALLLGMAAAEVKRLDSTFEVNWTRASKLNRPVGDDLRSAFAVLDRKNARLRVPMEKFSRQYGILFRRLKMDELYVCASATVNPLEFDVNSSFFADLAEGIANGGLAFYVRPAADLCTEYYEVYGFKEIQSVADMTDQFHQLGEALVKQLQKVKKLTRDQVSSLVRDHLHQIYVGKDEHFPFFMPGFVTSMFHSKDGDFNPERRMIVRLPGNFCGPIYLEEYRVFDARFGHAVLKVVNDRLKAGTEEGEARKGLENVKRILEAKPAKY